MSILTSEIVFIKCEDIKVKEGRQRQEFNTAKLLELAESIRDKQMLTPITVQSLEDLTLVAGERRLKAVTALHKKGMQITFNGMSVPEGCIPAVLAGSLTELQAEELELDENLKRENLTWKEQAAAIARLEVLRGKQHDLNPTEVAKPTNKSIAREIEKSQAETHIMRQVANHLDDPDVAKAKDAREAQKIIQRKAKEEHIKKQAAAVSLASIAHDFKHMDCREYVKGLEDNLISCIVTDPPYGIEMHKGTSWDGSKHEYEDTEEYFTDLLTSLVPEWDRVTKDEAHAYVFCDFAKFERVKAIFLSYRKQISDGVISFRPEFINDIIAFNTGTQHLHKKTKEFNDWYSTTVPVFDPMYLPMIWSKGNVASYPRAEHWPRKSYECILYLIKGNKKHNKLDLAVIDHIPQIQNQDHPAGKPAELYKYLLNRSTLAGDSVLDCFVGQGKFYEACQELKLFGYGCELSDKYKDLALLTLENLKG